MLIADSMTNRRVGDSSIRLLADWYLAQLLGYMDSRSGTRRFEAERGFHHMG
ncbi:MAG: hypothetical protein M1281_20050 [Chloroflexi bacterium]|nr:hypothetical protein [Chloroflexota bacterium]